MRIQRIEIAANDRLAISKFTSNAFQSSSESIFGHFVIMPQSGTSGIHFSSGGNWVLDSENSADDDNDSSDDFNSSFSDVNVSAIDFSIFDNATFNSESIDVTISFDEFCDLKDADFFSYDVAFNLNHDENDVTCFVGQFRCFFAPNQNRMRFFNIRKFNFETSSVISVR